MRLVRIQHANISRLFHLPLLYHTIIIIIITKNTKNLSIKLSINIKFIAKNENRNRKKEIVIQKRITKPTHVA